MARTREGRRLTETHRLAQTRLGARTIELMLGLWRLIEPDNVDRTASRWLRVAIPLIEQQRAASTALAMNYLTAFRVMERGPAAFNPVAVNELDRRQASIALTVTGPVALKVATARGEQLARAVDIAQTMSSRAAMRLVLAGGRETIIATVEQDRAAMGWARATSGRPCAFCAMLASRGAVFRGEDTASFQAHDGCSCTAEPVYGNDAALPPGAERYRDIWNETGNLAAFREALASQA